MKLSRILHIDTIKRNLATVFSFFHLGFIQGANALAQILIIPVITHIIGLAEIGHVMVSASYAGLVSLLVNYGSNQSGVKDVAMYRDRPERLAETFYTIYLVRFAIFTLCLLGLLLAMLYPFPYSGYFILANAIILGETLNPYFLFVGLQNLFLYNVVNLVSKLVSAAMIILFIRSSGQGGWYNFYLGIANSIGYFALCIYGIKKYQLKFKLPPIQDIKRHIRKNAYLTGNNLSVQLQQSFFLFVLTGTGDALLLGAYAICDKIVWSFRLLIIAFSNSVYPKAVALYGESMARWRLFKKKMNGILFLLFFCAGICLYLFAGWIVLVITGQHDTLTVMYVRAICAVPLVAALNALNVIDLVMKGRYNYIFIIALLLLIISASASELFVLSGNRQSFGFYPLVVEIFSLPLYWYFIRRHAQQPLSEG